MTQAYPSAMLRDATLSNGGTPQLCREDRLERIHTPEAEVREDMKRSGVLEAEAHEHDRRLQKLKVRPNRFRRGVAYAR